ncbi:MAG: RNase adapter RapZ [Acidobacteria bacterium]|nr:RNase adapter RapZ [Acidobacteriota bacterium]
MGNSTLSKVKRTPAKPPAELVIITGLSGSGKATVLRALEDLGYYAVDHLPVDLIPTFADLTHQAKGIARAALVIDVREGEALQRFPEIFADLTQRLRTTLVFLEADAASLKRRFSETRRPHPLGRQSSIDKLIKAEIKSLAPIRALADPVINTTRLTGHDLRRLIEEKFGGVRKASSVAISVISFGFKNGPPADADLVFDVRFLPNPNYVPELRKKNGKDPAVADFVRQYPQTQEFISRVTDLLQFLLPHYVKEGKSYLTIAFGCTGGHHRSVMIADEVCTRLIQSGFDARSAHRDIRKAY